MAMVAVLQSAGLIASSPVHSTSSSSSSSPPPVRHLSLALPHAHRPLPLCSGLRVSFLSKKQKNAHIRPGLVACSSPTIVCQQQQEAIAAAGEVTDKTWKELVLNSKVPVLVDFWAPWCGPCRMIAPLVDDLAKQYAGKLICLKLNTDESPNLATEYGIRSIPTVMIFKGGEKKDTVIGAVPKAALTSLVEKFLDM